MLLFGGASLSAAADFQTSRSQMQLNAMGYDAGPVDGIWGKKTASAIREFMLDHGQVFDGVFDNEAALIANVYQDSRKQVSNTLNQTTSRYKRSQYNCHMAQNLDEVPDSAYSVVKSNHLFAFANLDGDTTPDLIQGYTAEPHDPIDISKPVDYAAALSTGGTFDTSLPNLLARKILVQDFNQDGKDDVAFLNAGRHKAPRKGLSNRLLLSNNEGFHFGELPGGSKISHGGAAGDLDRDGDIDIVVANGQQRNVQMLVNQGNGTFRAKTLHSSFPGEPYTAEIWDIDSDGYLDIVFGTGMRPGEKASDGIFVAWGKTSRKDAPAFNKLVKYRFDSLKHRMALDFAFADFNGNGRSEMAVLDTRIKDRYQGWGISLISFDASRKASIEILHDHDPGSNYRWIAWIDDCDFNHDGRPDIVSLQIGEDGMYFIERPKLFLWRNAAGWEWEVPGIDKDSVYRAGDVRNLVLARNFCQGLIWNKDWQRNVTAWIEEAGDKLFTKYRCRKLYVAK